MNPDAAFRVLGIWSRAFTKDGIALNLTDARYVRGKDAAHLKGAFAYKAADPNAQGQELARGASWGSFELAIPQALIAKQTAAVYTASVIFGSLTAFTNLNSKFLRMPVL